MLLLLIGLHESVFLARELACKVITILTLITSNYNYYSLKSFACIILLLSGSIQYYSYMHNLSFDNRAYGQAAEVEDGRLNMVDGQEQTGDDEASEDSSNDDETASSTLTTEDSISEDNPPPPQPEQLPKKEQPPQPEQLPKEEQPPQPEQLPKEEQPPQPEQLPKEEQPPQPEQLPKEEQPPQQPLP